MTQADVVLRRARRGPVTTAVPRKPGGLSWANVVVTTQVCRERALLSSMEPIELVIPRFSLCGFGDVR